MERLSPPPRWARDAARKERGGGDDKDVPPQLSASRALANDGLSGFPARAKALLSFGAAFSVARPFLWYGAVAVILFSVLVGVAGPGFIHGGTPAVSPPPVVDPYDLLDDIREAPYVGFRE